MLHTHRPARLVVTFHGFITPVPPLSVPAGWGQNAQDRLGDRIRRHLRPYLGSRVGQMVVEASPDVPTGHVLVPTAGQEPGVAGYLHLEAETQDNKPTHRAGIPGWVTIGLVVLVALLLLG